MSEETFFYFDEKMARSIAQARSGQGLPVDEVFDRLITEIAEASGEKQGEIWSELCKSTDDDPSLPESYMGIVAAHVMQKLAEMNGLSDMSLEDINEEISAVRKERGKMIARD